MTVDTAALGQLTVVDRAGNSIAIGSAWAQKPAVLVWLRHFG